MHYARNALACVNASRAMRGYAALARECRDEFTREEIIKRYRSAEQLKTLCRLALLGYGPFQ